MKTMFRIMLTAIMLTAFAWSAPATGSVFFPAETLEDAPNPEAPNARFASLSFKMDGVAVEATIPGVIVIYNPAKQEVNIRGNTPKGLFSISMNCVNGPGTYTIKGTSKSGAGIMTAKKMYEVKKADTPFTIIIIAVDEIAAVHAPEAKAIRGTFSGIFMDSEGHAIEITDGKFSTQ